MASFDVNIWEWEGLEPIVLGQLLSFCLWFADIDPVVDRVQAWVKKNQFAPEVPYK